MYVPTLVHANDVDYLQAPLDPRHKGDWRSILKLHLLETQPHSSSNVSPLAFAYAQLLTSTVVTLFLAFDNVACTRVVFEDDTRQLPH